MGHFEEKLSTHCEFQLSYLTLGTGTEVYLCFHGFGRSSRDYLNYVNLLPNSRIIAVDMFFHGGSKYPPDRINRNPITKEELIGAINKVLIEEEVDRFKLIGYSMGGRISQLIVENMPERIEALYLMAPDAIKDSPWYHFASRTSVGRVLYKSTINHPGWLFGLMTALSFIRLIPRTLTKFVKFQMETKAKRELVYNVWMALRKIDPDLARVKNNIQEGNIPYLIVFGRYDRVIPPHLADKFTKGIEERGSSITIENGHNFVKTEIEEEVCDLILKSQRK